MSTETTNTYCIYKIVKAIQQCLHPGLLKPQFRGNPNKFYGHCYVASEALWHLTGKTLHVYRAKDEHGVTHWWLEDADNVYDPTSRQYTDCGSEPPYTQGRRSGFLTTKPSKRAAKLIAAVERLI